jgi:MFS family permease
MSAGTTGLRRTFSALGVRNFRLYFIGQTVSVSGHWMQTVAFAWLVLELTGDGVAVGAVTAAQFLPVLLIGPLGGLIADRVDKRKLLATTQTMAAVVAGGLGVAVLTDRAELWVVYAGATALGILRAVDNPTQNALLMEMVGRKRITNAVALNSVVINGARVVGPAIGGILIVTVGIGLCFVVNAASYFGVLVAVIAMRSSELDQPEPQPAGRGQLREALAYVRMEPRLRVVLLMVAMISVFAYQFEVSLPLFARFTFDGGAEMFGLMFAVLGVGAVAGGLYTAARGATTRAVLVRTAVAFGLGLAVTAVAPTLWLALGALLVTGGAGTAFLSHANAVLQLSSRPHMRGRVLALRSMAFLGIRPVGSITVGWVCEHVGPRFGLGLGALAAIGVAAWARSFMPEIRASDQPLSHPSDRPRPTEAL